MADFANIITLVSGNLPGENRADTLRGRRTGGTDRRRCRCGGRAGMGHRRSPDRHGGPGSRPIEPAALQRGLPRRRGSVRATRPAGARHPDPNFAIKGVRVRVMGWLHDDIGFTLGDTLLGFLRGSQPARPRTRYNILGDGTIEAGFAPSVGYAGRIVGDSATALYLGGALHYYVGLAYGHVTGDGGFTTGDSIFTGPTPVKPDARALTSYSKFGNSVGHGFGGDIGVALVTGPIEVGVGVNDIGATITWPDTRVDSAFYRDSTAAHNGPPVRYSTPVLPNHIETKTKLPVSYLVNLAYTVGKTTLGADVLNNGRGTTVHVGGEQRVGVIVLRGGVARDQRERMEFGPGGGLRFGGLGLDVGFWTHRNSLSNQLCFPM